MAYARSRVRHSKVTRGESHLEVCRDAECPTPPQIEHTGSDEEVPAVLDPPSEEEPIGNCALSSEVRTVRSEIPQGVPVVTS